MKIIIDIPEEFESHFERDRFDDSLCRLRTDAHCIAGKYEQELCDMLIEAFNNGTPLPKGHGRLIDADELKTLSYEVLVDTDNPNREDGLSSANGVVEEDIDLAPTIIEADGGED